MNPLPPGVASRLGLAVLQFSTAAINFVATDLPSRSTSGDMSSHAGTTDTRRIYVCPMCSFESPTRALNLSHLHLVQRNDPRFNMLCGIGGCTHTSRTFSSLYSHIYRSHRDCGIIEKRGECSTSGQSDSATPGDMYTREVHVDPDCDDLPG